MKNKRFDFSTKGFTYKEWEVGHMITIHIGVNNRCFYSEEKGTNGFNSTGYVDEFDNVDELNKYLESKNSDIRFTFDGRM